MRRASIWNAVVAICFSAVTLVSARICVLGTEPHESVGGKVRFVLPPGDPCSCTEIMLGGHNAYATPRKDKPVYIDNLPMDAEGLRRSQGCPDESTQREYQMQTSTSQVETSDSPTTREARVVYTDCQDALGKGQVTSGVYTIEPYGNEQFEAYCDMTPNEGYIVIQRRLNGSVDFDRDWADYKKGFGDLDGEFWLGNEKIHKITSKEPKYELLVNLTAFDGSVAQARYKDFVIKGEKESYEINPSFDSETPGGTINAGDGLDSKKFTTIDQDNDDDEDNCALMLSGGWWFAHCSGRESNLNGRYSDTTNVQNHQGIYWSQWKGSDQPLKATEMKIRRCTNSC